jgi:hypothetical protein
MVSVRSTQEEYIGRSKNSPITCAATRHMELAEFSVLLGPPTLQRPRGLRETSPQLRRFLILGRGLYGDGEARSPITGNTIGSPRVLSGRTKLASQVILVVMALRTDGNQRYNWMKNRRSLWTRPLIFGCGTISCCLSAAFSASSRLLDLKS